MTNRRRYDQVVFSGGGTRCFWHGGFLSEFGTFEDVRPKRISAVSGGALTAAAWIAGHDQQCKDAMEDLFKRNESNIALDESNMTPHQEMYRESVERALSGGGVEAVADGPDLQIVLAKPPQSLPTRLLAAFYAATYQLDQHTRSTPHLKLPTKLGLKPLRVDAREAARQGKLIDLICAAATIPPVFDVPEWNGVRVIDGGMVEKAPLPEPDEGTTLVLLTRIYRNLPQSDRVTYYQPSRPVEADKIDFTCHEKIAETWDQGREDARRMLG